MTKTKLVWRLANRPTPSEVQDLHTSGLITKDEAREILFSAESETDRDTKSLEAEIKFLRELVERLSKNSQTVITTIREIERPWSRYPWYQPYYTWCNAVGGSNLNLLSAGTSTLQNAVNTSVSNSANLQTNASFSAIKTF